MRRPGVKSELVSILNKITTHTKCILVYGSYSRIEDKVKPGISDIDFIVIYKNNVNPYTISLKIEGELKEKNIHYDYCWYFEDYFLSLINNKIDLYLFYSIFFNGEILFSESNFINQVQAIILNSNPAKIFKETYNHRNNNNSHLFKIWARNLSRILFDYICALYCKNQEIDKWHNLPEFDKIVLLSKELGIIENEIYDIHLRLTLICKKTDEVIFEEMNIIRRELVDFNLIIENYSTA